MCYDIDVFKIRRYKYFVHFESGIKPQNFELNTVGASQRHPRLPCAGLHFVESSWGSGLLREFWV